MGTVTHGSVQAIDVNARFQRVNGEQNLDLSVYKMVTENVSLFSWVRKKSEEKVCLSKKFCKKKVEEFSQCKDIS